jgi:hypothetical protein
MDFEPLQEYPEPKALLLQSGIKPGKPQIDVMQWITKKYDRSKAFWVFESKQSLRFIVKESLACHGRFKGIMAINVYEQ